MPAQKIIGVIVLIVLLIFLIYVFNRKDGTQLSSQQSASIMTTISASELPNSSTQNYAYSIWLYIDDWNYKYGEDKYVLTRMDTDKNPSPVIKLGAFSNNAIISVQCYPDTNTSDPGVEQTHHCNVSNIPLQTWVNLLVSLNGRTLDIYQDGKLVRTCVLPGVAKIAQQAPVIVTPGGGFSGWTSNVKYWANSLNPQEAWNIYRKGYGGSVFGNLFNEYRIKVSFLNNNLETGSFEI